MYKPANNHCAVCALDLHRFDDRPAVGVDLPGHEPFTLYVCARCAALQTDAAALVSPEPGGTCRTCAWYHRPSSTCKLSTQTMRARAEGSWCEEHRTRIRVCAGFMIDAPELLSVSVVIERAHGEPAEVVALQVEGHPWRERVYASQSDGRLCGWTVGDSARVSRLFPAEVAAFKYATAWLALARAALRVVLLEQQGGSAVPLPSIAVEG